jgi:hypothetical protein
VYGFQFVVSVLVVVAIVVEVVIVVIVVVIVVIVVGGGAFRLGNHSNIVMGAYFHGSAYLQTLFNTTAIWWFLFPGIRLSRHAPDSLNDKQLSIYIQISKYQTPTKLSKCYTSSATTSTLITYINQCC